MPRERRRVLFSGTVQGVGFRWTAARELQGLAVTGFVRNLPDGRVELVLEGEPEQTGAALARVESALGRYIRGKASEVLPATGEFREFGIRR